MAGGLRNVNAVVTITTNAVKAIEDGKKLKEVYAAINQQLNLMRAEGKTDTTEFKEMQKLAEDTKAKIDALVTGMKLIRGVVDNLANKQGRDLNRALRETAKEFNRTANDTDKHKAKLEQLRQSVAALKRELSDRKGLTMSFTDAQKQLQNLANTPLDKLRAGLASIRAELEGDINSKTRSKLQSWENQYAAQIAIKETGTIPSSSLAGVQQADRTRLEAERKRLVDAYNVASMSEDKQHIQWSNLALQRIQALNGALKQLNEEEQKRDKATRDAAAAKERFNQAERVSANVASGTKQSIQDLTDAYKNYGEYLKTVEGVNQPEAERVKANMQDIKQALTDISQIDVQKTIDSLSDPNAATNLEQLEAALKQLKENAATIGMHDDIGFQKYTEDVEKLEAAIDQVKLKLQGLADIDYAHLENYSTEKLQAELKNLEAQEKKLSGTQKKEAELVARKKTLITNQLKKNEVAVIDFANAEKIASERGKHSVTEMQIAYDALKAKLVNLAANEKEAIKQTRKQMDQLKKDINSVTGEVSGLQKVWKSAVRNIATYAGLFAGYGFIKSKIQEIVKSTLSLSDSMAQVQKVTGLTKQEVDSLNVSFSKLDTRTTLSGLNDLAYSAGKMGLGKYGVEGIRQFVEATNQLQVALGDDLGSSIEDSITPLAKLAENLGMIQKMGVEKSMLAIGSSINELSQTTTAAGRNIVDFARRIQPSAQMIGLTTDEILALGSASDSFGVASEISATAFTKFLAAYRTNTAEIERILGITRGTLDEFFDQGRTMEGLLTIFQRMHEIGDLRYLEEAFKALGSEGSRMFTTFGAFAKNIDMFKEHLTTSTVAFAEATSVTREYNLVQETAAGLIERSSNIWEKAFVNPEGVDTMKELAAAWYDLSKELTSSTTYMTEVKVSLMSIASVAKILIQSLPILIRLMMFYGVGKVLHGIIFNFNAIYRAITLAGTAATRFNAVLKTNFIAVAVMVLGYLATKWLDVAMAEKEAAKELDAVSDAEKKAMEACKNDRAELKRLYDATKDTTKSIDERKEALRKMVGDEKYHQYKQDLSDEQVLAREAAKAYSELTDEIIKTAKARAYDDKINELTKKNVDLETANDEAKEYLKTNKGKYESGKKEYKNQQEYARQMTGGATAGFQESGIVQQGAAMMQPKIIGEYEQKQRDIVANQEAMKKNDADILKLEHKIKDLNGGNATANTGSTIPSPSGGGKGGSGSSKELNAEFRDEQAKVKDIINKVKNYYQRQINAINDMATVGTIDEQQQKEMVEGMQSRMNTALAEVRKAIGGTKNDWDKFKQTMIDDLYEPLNEEGTNWSVDIVNDILDNDLVQLRAMIEKLSKALNKNGQQLLEQILRKASEDEARNINLANKQMRARQDELRRKNYTEQTDYNYIGVMDQFQIGDTTEAQDAQIQAWSQAGDKKAIEDFFAERTKLWRDGFKQARENLLAVIDADVETEKGHKDLLTLLYGEDYETTLKGSALEGLLSMDATQWKLYYKKLIEYSDAWDDAQKKMYEEQKKRADYRFENRADVQGLNQMEKGYESLSRDNARWGKPQSFAERMGLGKMSTITEDPEVKMMEVRLTRASLYYKEMERLRQMNLVSQEMMNDAEQKMMDAQIALQDKIAEQAKEKIQQIQALLDPIKDFGAAAGEAMYMTVNGLDGEGEAWRNAIKSIIKTYGEMTIQMIEKQLIQMLVMKQHHQEQEDEEQAHQDRMKQIQGQGSTNMVNAQSLLNAKIISTQKKGAKAEEKEQKRSEDTKVDIAGEGGQTMLDLGATVASGLVNTKKEEAQETQQIEQQQQATSLSGLISDTVAKVVLGIAGGSAKTISELGWWGLPLVAVISAALMGLLNYALSAIGGGGKQSNNNSAAKTNVKLKSGMLTYDEGNVGMFAGRRKLYDDGTTQVYDREGSRPAPFVGQDGHVYMATPRGGIPEGVSLVKQPIATTVNGQPSLVAEKGPEIVIGRRTTARIMMNEPRLLHHLATLGNGRRGLKLFDEGNLGDMVGGGRNNDITSSHNNNEKDAAINAALERNAAALEQNAAAMAAFSQVMQQIQANGIQGVFREYGAGSLDESMRKVNAFRRRYPVG